MSENYQRFSSHDLHRFTCQVLERLDVPPDDARAVADCLIRSDLMGVDSHGIAHLDYRLYARGLEAGHLNPRPRVRVVRETDTTALIDGDNCLGPVADEFAVRLCIEKAKRHAVGAVSVGNSGHAGMVGHWALMCAEHDLLGFAYTVASALVAPAGGTRAMLGTNPIACAAPALEEHPFLYDAATSAVAYGKLEIAMRKGAPIPRGWALDQDGRETTDPAAMRPDGALLPLGSFLETGAHKGTGLGLMVSILCGLLSGAGLEWNFDRSRMRWGQFFLAMRIDAFQPLEAFKRSVDEMLRGIRAAAPRPGVERVLAPGDKEFAHLADRSANGVPLHPRVVESLHRLAADYGVERVKPL